MSDKRWVCGESVTYVRYDPTAFRAELDCYRPLL